MVSVLGTLCSVLRKDTPGREVLDPRLGIGVLPRV